MSAKNFPFCLTQILQAEGGFVDDPRDPGGATNLGVTVATLSHWQGKPASVQDVRNLTVGTVAPIYHQAYWNAVQCDALPSGVDLMVFNMAVNAGPGRAARLLQQSVGAAMDGMIGPATLARVAAMSAPALITEYATDQSAFYRSLATFPTFGKGWLGRLATIEQAANSLVDTTGARS